MNKIKELFSKHKKAVLIGLVLTAALLAFYFYKKGRFKDNFHGQARAEQLGLTDPGRFGASLGFTTDWKHGLKVGDKVNIAQDSGAKHPAYDGETTVTSILSEYDFLVNKNYAGSSPVNGGRYTKIAA
jgi:hypothetical protein